MEINSDANQKQATRNDHRITRLGAFLRRTSIDELPQFFNVLIGNMSVVGPRPHMISHTEQYSRLIDKFMVRHFLKPGITGYAQVNGLRGETKTTEAMLQRVEADVWYLENWSFLLDLKIIFLTVWNVVKGDENAF
jgi:lipopolysaccharide/colanic/teichoic acid biosynthesis glycosyltransferase